MEQDHFGQRNQAVVPRRRACLLERRPVGSRQVAPADRFYAIWLCQAGRRRWLRRLLLVVVSFVQQSETSFILPSGRKTLGWLIMPRKPKRKPKRIWEQPPERKRGRKLALVFAGLLVAGAVVYWTSRSGRPVEPAPLSRPQTEGAQQLEEIPPFFERAEAAKPFPATLSPASFRNPRVARAYQVAREIPEVLVQQPCYCHCDKFGHRGLLDCYRTDHGAG